ncbi:condensation domain-containing protein, partial [Acidobacteriota bacterium]
MGNQAIFSEELITAYQKTREKEFWLKKLFGELVKSHFYYDIKPIGNIHRHFKSRTFSITEEIFSRLLQISNNSDLRLHMILTVGLLILIKKFTGDNDIVIGAPVYKQQMDMNADTEIKFTNTVLILRNPIDAGITFKELLLQVKQTISEAANHVNYPVKLLAQQLGFQFSQNEDFPLFDISILLENIHDKKYLQHFNHNMIFSFVKKGNCIEGILEYNSSLYLQETILQIINYFSHILKKVLFDVNLKISELELISSEEKEKLLYEFNDTRTGYHNNKTIHQLFEEQVERTP